MSVVDEMIFLSLERRHVSIKSVASISRAKSTVVKIELDITDAYTLARLMEDLHQARAVAAQPKSNTRQRRSE